MKTTRPYHLPRPHPIRSRVMKGVPIWTATAAPTQYWSGPVSPAPWATTPPISSRTPSLLSPVPIPIVPLQLSDHLTARIQSQSLVMIARITRYSQMTTAPGLCMEWTDSITASTGTGMRIRIGIGIGIIVLVLKGGARGGVQS
jgi:hypothetical protein